VSPIIATILLVAITVVLAAVLYVLVSGLTRTGASTPYSLQMAVSSAACGGGTCNVYLSLSPTSGLTTGAFGMSVTLVSTSGTVATAAVPAACKNGVAATLCVGVAGGWYAVLVSGGNVVATYGNATAIWGNYAHLTNTIALTGAYTMNIVSTATYDDGNHNLGAFGVGASSVSGQVTL